MQHTEVKTKLKPWGREIWFAQTQTFAGKILEIKKGHRYSLQYHEFKSECQYLYSGKIKFTYGEDIQQLKEVVLEPGDKFDVKPGLIHRAQALEDSIIFEVSTPELNDVIKLQDDYGRSGKGNDEIIDTQLHESSK